MLRTLFRRETRRRETLIAGQVVPDSIRCVQCGICSYNCPINIDVRDHARKGEPINSSHCLTCGECVARCPRGVLRFERSDLFA
ncbi:MAG TPA: 4Fe-4S dicluster domain-containing protein [Anaerolineales bacterium]|nr:4Fe-4S dicluster domain-containing protein [Anaerolineales bacterium]